MIRLPDLWSLRRVQRCTFASCSLALITPLLLSTGWGQEAAEKKATNTDGAVLALSPFRVDATQGRGYIVNSATSGFKTEAPLIDLPQSLVVVSRDMIEAVNQPMNNIDTLRFFVSGVTTFAQDIDLIYMRGFRGTRLGLEGVIEQGATITDNVDIDSYEVVKGPTAALYGQRTGLAGAVFKITKKPQETSRFSVRTSVGTEGFRRVELDATGPLAKMGDSPVLFRLIGASQKYDGFNEVDFDNRDVIAPSLQFSLSNNTSVLLQYNHSEIKRGIGSGDSFLNADKTDINPVTIEKSFRPRWQHTTNDRDWGRITVDHRFNDDWSLRLFYDRGSYHNFVQEAANSGAPNYTLNVINSFFYVVDDQNDQETVSLDGRGKFKLFGIDNTINFGIVGDDVSTDSKTIVLRNVFPLSPLDNPNRLDYPLPPLVGWAPSLTTSKSVVYYYSQAAKFFGDRLHLVGGIARDELKASGLVDTEVGYPYRLGALYKVRPDVSLYINNSTTFAVSNVNTPDGRRNYRREDKTLDLGVKTALWNGRVNATVTYFDLQQGNVANWIIGTYPQQYTITPTVTSKGWEFDLAVTPFKGLTIIGTLFDTKLRDANGVTPSYAVEKTNSLFAAYKVPEGVLKGFSFGGTMAHMGGRQAFPYMKHTVYGAFLAYDRGRWRAAVNIDNLTDNVYTSGGYGQPYNTAGRPRNARLTLDLLF